MFGVSNTVVVDLYDVAKNRWLLPNLPRARKPNGLKGTEAPKSAVWYKDERRAE